jgi:protoporphyrinogen oxidase
MSTDWLGPRLYKPDLEQVFNGALSPKTEDVHYITDFRYPTHNGFVSYLNMFIQDSDIKLSHHVVSVDADQKQVVFGNGVTAEYDYLISSMPLTELVPVIKNVPENVVYAVQQLACSMCVVVNIGLDRDNISEAHVSYFYDDDIVFTRLSFPHMQSVNNAPPGKGSIQAELYYSKKYKPFDKTPEQCIAPTINDLKRCGLIHDDDIVLSSSAKVIEYANIIYDLDRASAVATVLDYLKNVGIETCGRYGEWGYMWTDESFISGENAAQRILGRL